MIVIGRGADDDTRIRLEPRRAAFLRQCPEAGIPVRRTTAHRVSRLGLRAYSPNRAQAERYRDRFRGQRRSRVDRLETTAVRELLGALDKLSTALDLPAGTGRLASLLADVAERVILADVSSAMLEVAREGLSNLPVEYVQTDAKAIALADGSVDLVFCHRLLNHVRDAGIRACILREWPVPLVARTGQNANVYGT